MSRARRLLFLVMMNVAYLSGCERSAEPASSDLPAVDAEVWPELRQPLVEDYLKAHPMFAVVAGRHEYDGLLPDWSAAGIAARDSPAARVRGIGRWRCLTRRSAEHARFERDNFVARIDRDLFWLETAEAPFTQPGVLSRLDASTTSIRAPT